MGEVDNMTLQELLEYADRELDIIIRDFHKAANLERRMRAEARRSFPKGISSLQEYAEILRDGYKVPWVYTICYDYIENRVIIASWVLRQIPIPSNIMFADRELATKFRDENLEELEWYFKEYQRLI